MINLWEDPRMKKQTMHPEDIEEIIMVEILAIGAIVMKTDSTLGEENLPIPRLPKKIPGEAEFEKTMREFVIAQKTVNGFVNNQFYNLKTKVEQGQKNHQAVIQDLETKFGRIFDHQSLRPTSKTYDPPANPNTKIAVFLDDSDDEADEVKKEVEPLPKKPTQTDAPPLKAYKLKIPYPQRLNKERIGADYAKFLDMIKEVRINVPLVDVLAGMPNYGKFLKDLVSNKILDALLDDSKPFLNTSEKISKTPLDKEFDEFMSENVQEDEVKDDFEELPLKDELRIKTSIQDPPTDLEMKPLPKHLEYAFLEENSFLPVVISALLKQNEKERLISVLKNHKEAFAWKTSDILGISPSFCKHKINFEDDVKPVIQRQRRLNPNIKEVVKKEIIKLLDACIIYTIEDSPRFDIEIKNKKGAENVVRDHFSRHLSTRSQRSNDEEINDEFPDEPYLFKACPDGMIRRCVHGLETRKILDECHHGPTGGHYGPSITPKNVFDAGFYWPTIFQEAQTLVQNYDAYQCSGSISRRDEMPLKKHLVAMKIFDRWELISWDLFRNPISLNTF
ncbi:hypothetical protein Tco_0428809 [Tanacetum coccineum]